jgi:hypothetical protein
MDQKTPRIRSTKRARRVFGAGFFALAALLAASPARALLPASGAPQAAAAPNPWQGLGDFERALESTRPANAAAPDVDFSAWGAAAAAKASRYVLPAASEARGASAPAPGVFLFHLTAPIGAPLDVAQAVSAPAWRLGPDPRWKWSLRATLGSAQVVAFRERARELELPLPVLFDPPLSTQAAERIVTIPLPAPVQSAAPASDAVSAPTAQTAQAPRDCDARPASDATNASNCLGAPVFAPQGGRGAFPANLYDTPEEAAAGTAIARAERAGKQAGRFAWLAAHPSAAAAAAAEIAAAGQAARDAQTVSAQPPAFAASAAGVSDSDLAKQAAAIAQIEAGARDPSRADAAALVARLREPVPFGSPLANRFPPAFLDDDAPDTPMERAQAADRARARLDWALSHGYFDKPDASAMLRLAGARAAAQAAAKILPASASAAVAAQSAATPSKTPLAASSSDAAALAALARSRLPSEPARRADSPAIAAASAPQPPAVQPRGPSNAASAKMSPPPAAAQASEGPDAAAGAAPSFLQTFAASSANAADGASAPPPLYWPGVQAAAFPRELYDDAVSSDSAADQSARKEHARARMRWLAGQKTAAPAPR